MGDRPARIYREHPGQPYTRQSQKKKDNYIKGAPAPRITQFEQGAKKKEFPKSLELRIEEECQVRSEALEAGRVAANSHLSKVLDPEEGYFLKIIPYPHHVLRYHPLAGVAQADRYYEGMRKPFGRPIGRSALVNEDQAIIRVEVGEEDVDEARKALERAGDKMPVTCRVRVVE
ncbi:50S ribosomal protein L16 [Candidatus Nanohaloarchaea archaeon]|nr:50S ribosomal protein L16 [Candidatus Nanohaloarchaea archaeon]